MHRSGIEGVPWPLATQGSKALRSVAAGYYPLQRFPQKTLYALEEIVGERE